VRGRGKAEIRQDVSKHCETAEQTLLAGLGVGPVSIISHSDLDFLGPSERTLPVKQSPNSDCLRSPAGSGFYLALKLNPEVRKRSFMITDQITVGKKVVSIIAAAPPLMPNHSKLPSPRFSVFVSFKQSIVAVYVCPYRVF